MTRLMYMPKPDTGRHAYVFWCPGCQCHHAFYVGDACEKRWSFNGDLDNPTFEPSLLNKHPDGRICHLHLIDGKIHYLQSDHDYSDRVIELVEMD